MTLSETTVSWCWVSLYSVSRFICCNAECRYAECHYAECRGAKRSINMEKCTHSFFLILLQLILDKLLRLQDTQHNDIQHNDSQQNNGLKLFLCQYAGAIMPSVTFMGYYTECHYAECRYAKCNHTYWHGAIFKPYF